MPKLRSWQFDMDRSCTLRFHREEDTMYTGDKYRDEVSRIYGCERCNLHMTRDKVVVYRGNPRSDIMVLGMAPGPEEDRQGIPMVGPTGSYLVALLEQNGLPLIKYYITNSVLCYLAPGQRPTISQLNACSRWLNWQIDMVKPRWILAAGNVAYSRVNPRFSMSSGGITRIEGEIVTPLHLAGVKVVAIQHPSAIKRTPSKTEAYEKLIAGVVKRIRDDLGF